MEGGARKSDSVSFLCSPIPRDPTQSYYVDERSRAALSYIKDSVDDFLTPEVQDMARIQMETENPSSLSPGYVQQLQKRVAYLEKQRQQSSTEKENDETADERNYKRKRIELESIAISKSEDLSKEIAALKIRLESKNEAHQVEIQHLTMENQKLCRQLRYVSAEEEETRNELKKTRNEFTTEKLQLQKKVVELASQLTFVETTLAEWKDKAIESDSQLTQQKKTNAIERQMLQDEVEQLKQTVRQSQKTPDASVLESKVRELETSLTQKDLEVDEARTKVRNAKETIENASKVRVLVEKINSLERTERKLKAQLVSLIESAKNSELLDEKLYQMRQKWQLSEQKLAQTEQKVQSLLALEETQKQFVEYFEVFVRDSKDVSLELLKENPSVAVMKLYQQRQNAFELLFEQKNNVELQLKQHEAKNEQLTKQIHVLSNKEATLETQAVGLEQNLQAANDVVSHLKTTNDELMALLETYENETGPVTTEGTSQRLKGLETSLKKSNQLLEMLETSQRQMASPAVLKKVQGRVERLEKQNAVLTTEAASLSKLLTKAEAEIAVFERRLGRGDFNVETTKVVHLSVNPTRELLQKKQTQNDQLIECQAENERLRQQLASVTGVDHTTNHSPPLDDTMTTTTSYETVTGQKLLNQRLKEVFREQIQQYREAVTLLTGYKIELKKSHGAEVLRLRSLFADHDDDELLIRMDAKGALELLKTDFCGQIDQRVFAYLTTCHSFPAFLSNLTLHLFERQTFQG